MAFEFNDLFQYFMSLHSTWVFKTERSKSDNDKLIHLHSKVYDNEFIVKAVQIHLFVNQDNLLI